MSEQFGIPISKVVSRVLPPTTQETKLFEEYLLIKNTIEDECRSSVKEILLQKLEQAYKAGYDLMDVLKWIRK